jgi:hypothetical protein
VRPATAARLDPLRIGAILESPGGSLVRQEVLTSDHADADAIEIRPQPAGPCSHKLDAIDGRQNVDAQRRQADLEYHARVREVFYTKLV